MRGSKIRSSSKYSGQILDEIEKNVVSSINRKREQTYPDREVLIRKTVSGTKISPGRPGALVGLLQPA